MPRHRIHFTPVQRQRRRLPHCLPAATCSRYYRMRVSHPSPLARSTSFSHSLPGKVWRSWAAADRKSVV